MMIQYPVHFHSRLRRWITYFLLSLPAILVDQKSFGQSPLFKLLSPKQTGIRFSNDINETENLNVLAYEYFYNGGGVAVGDINNDGLEDIFFTANMKPNKLYLNLGHLQFKDISAQAGIEGRKDGWKTGVTMADVNGDGLLDIYVCYSGRVSDDDRRNQLFINKGNLTFSEEARQYGLDDKSYSTQAAFFDFDNDGDLDMFLLNHSVRKIDNMELARYRNDVDSLAGDKLYENKNGHFVDVSKKAGLHQSPLTFGLGIAVADINKDGWQDVYVTNDYNEPDYLYINQHDGTFRDDTQNCLNHLAQFSMGVDIADFNNDGLPDIVNLDMLPEDNRRQKLLQLQENYESFQLMINQGLQKQYMHNMLQLNNGNGSFSEIAQLAGVSNTDWSWCPLLADFDNDGYKDLFISNGYMRDYTNKDFLRYWGDYKIKKAMDSEPMLLMDLVRAMPSTLVPNYIFHNNHDLTFTNEQKSWGLDQPVLSNGAVYADLDNDGDLDLVTNNINQDAFVYRNMAVEESRGHFLSVKLNGTGLNKNAIGAKVYVYAGTNQQYQELNPSRGYLSCVSTILNFGLGQSATVDSIRIIWPDNTTQLITSLPADQRLSINYPSDPAGIFTVTPGHPGKTIFAKSAGLIDDTREEFDENDFKRQPLMLFMYSNTGPVIAKADVNHDGLEDLFISGDRKGPGKVYLQQEGGSFRILDGVSIGDESTSAVSAAAFFDANGDGAPDLYVAKGGYSLFDPHTPALQDQLYLNDGSGNLLATQGFLPDVSASSKSCVRPCDFDGDGDIDLFVGGRVIPGQYPVAPTSYLLRNDGKGTFTTVQVPFSQVGMVTDAQWVDLNNDGRKDLVMCGEFMPVKVYINTAEGFIDKTDNYFSSKDFGFWNTLQVADLNGDGQPDLVAGNLGLNSQIRATEKEPAEMYYADFDHNGSIDPFFNFYIDGKSYPYVSRDEMNNQIFALRKKFTSYKDYADATMKDIFSADDLAKASKLIVNELRTVCYINENGRFKKTILPMQAQVSYVSNILVNDFTGDGKTDLLLLGNHSDNRLKLGSIDANNGCLLSGDGTGHFRYIPQPLSGLDIRGDVKSATEMKIGHQQYLVIGERASDLKFYKVQE